MNIERHVELLGSRQDRIETRIVEKAILRQSVDQGTAEPEVTHGPLQLIGGRLWAPHRQVGEGSEPIRMCGDRLPDYVVHVARQPDSFGAVQQIGAGSRCGENLHRNARLIHVGEASSANVKQWLFQAIVKIKRESALDNRFRIDPLDQIGKQIMFLEGDDAHGEFAPKLLSI